MIEGGGAVSAHSLLRKYNLAVGGDTGSAGPDRRYYAVNVVSGRLRSPWTPNRKDLCRGT